MATAHQFKNDYTSPDGYDFVEGDVIDHVQYHDDNYVTIKVNGDSFSVPKGDFFNHTEKIELERSSRAAR